jgi:hypothetical protein
MRTLGFSLCGFPASVSVPDEYFDERGVPRWPRLNARFSSASITWNTLIGGVPVDEPVVNQQQVPTIGEELQKLREVVAALEKKFDGVRS